MFADRRESKLRAASDLARYREHGQPQRHGDCRGIDGSPWTGAMGGSGSGQESESGAGVGLALGGAPSNAGSLVWVIEAASKEPWSRL